MKRFIINTSLFFLPIIIVSIILDFSISNLISKCHSTSYVADEFSVWNDIYDGKIDSDIAVYGSSRAWQHFNSKLLTEALGHRTYNFGVDGHSFWIQYLRHKEYLDHNRPPKVIVLSVDYGTFEKREDLYNYGQFLPYMLWNEDIRQYTSSYTGFKKQDFSLPLVRYMGKFGFIWQGIVVSLQDDVDLKKREKGFAAEDQKWNDDLSNAKEENKSFEIAFDGPTLELFDRFLKECYEKDITVLMVYAPMYFEGLELVANNHEVLDTIKSFAATHNLDFLDYSRDSISYDKSYFYNSNHLNLRGANLFTNKLVQDIKNTNAARRLKR